MRYIILCLFFAASLLTYGVSKEDSLLTVLKDAGAPQQKVELLLELGKIYHQQKDLDKTRQALNNGMEIARLADDPGLTAKCLIALGSVEAGLMDISKALSYYERARQLCIDHNLTMLHETNARLGSIWLHLGKYDKAQHCLNEALQGAEQAQDTNALYSIYLTLGSLNRKLSKHSKCMEYNMKAIDIAKSMGDSSKVGAIMFNLGNLIMDTDEKKKALEYYKKAWAYFQNSKELKYKAGVANALGNYFLVVDSNYSMASQYYQYYLNLGKEMKSDKAIGIAYNNIAALYEREKKYDESLQYYLKALEYKNKVGNQVEIDKVYLNLSAVYRKKKDFANALSSLAIIEPRLKEHNSLGVYAAYYDHLYMIYQDAEDPIRSLENYKLYVAYKDSMQHLEKENLLMELEAEFETKEKEQEIAFLKTGKELDEAKYEKQRLINYTTFGGLGVVVVLLVIVGYSYSTKKKANAALKEKNTIINAQQQKIVESITYAKRIQGAILPDQKEVTEAFPDSFIVNLPRDIVSGDFYWVGKVGNVSVCAVADCTGHGVPGGFMSMIGHMLMAEIVNSQNIDSPAEILEQLDHRIRMTLRQTGSESQSQDGMDLAVCAYNPDKNECTYSGALTSIFVHDGSELKTISGDTRNVGGTPLREHLNRPFTNHVFPVTANTKIYMMTDGYLDQFGGANDEKFNLSRMRQLLSEIAELPMAEQHDMVLAAFEKWKGNRDQLDDVCIIGLKPVV